VTKPRAKGKAIVAAAIVVTGSALGLTTLTAPPADAGTSNCSYIGPIYNGSHFLDDYGGGFESYVHTYPQTGSANQTWCLQPQEQIVKGGHITVYVYAISPLNNPGLCLDTHTYVSGQGIWLYTCNGTKPQLWCWNGTGYLVTLGNSAQAIDDEGLYGIVALENGPVNKWSSSAGPLPDNC
jgi:hypothetical protein